MSDLQKKFEESKNEKSNISIDTSKFSKKKKLMIPKKKEKYEKRKKGKIDFKLNFKSKIEKVKNYFQNLNLKKTSSPIKKKKEGKEKKKKNQYEQLKLFSKFIKKAGYDLEFYEINKRILLVSFSCIVILTIILVFNIIKFKILFSDAIQAYFILWFIGSAAAFILLWTFFFVYIDLRIMKRKKEIESVFPDYLHLTAANISSGMPIDRALWYAIRPRFGVLAKEMEEVAKSTLVGEKLDKALIDFSEKYDSVAIKRSFNLLLEGLNSGGEVGDLLRRIADNMMETEIMKKDMASSVTTYVIFIMFATLGAAPFLFGLTTQLIVIMSSIFSTIDLGESGQGGIGLMSGGSADIISLFDYQVFAITSICISSIFAAIIISVIQKGNTKEAIKNIPIFIPVGVGNYLVSYYIMRLFLGGLF